MDKHPTPIPTPAPIPTPHTHAPTPNPYPSYPYPCYPYYPRRPSSGKKTNLASCVVATAFLILLLFVAALVFFLLFRPRDPDVRIRGVQLPGFALRSGSGSGNGTSTSTGTAASFTFAQSASVRNPNRAAFSHYDSTIALLYRGSQLGFMYIPAGEIDGGRTQYMGASFAVPQFPLSNNDGTVMEVETRMKLKGRVTVLKFFMHHVEVTAACRVAVAAGNGAVLGVRC